MELREPKRKRVGSHIKPQQPFPILIESENDIIVESELWPVFLGNFTGDSVVVCNPEEVTTLYTMGFFGKGSLSRGYPSFGISKKGLPPVLKERQWKRRKCWMEKMERKSKNMLESSQDCESAKDGVAECNDKEKCVKPEEKEDISTKPTPMDVGAADSSQPTPMDVGAVDGLPTEQSENTVVKDSPPVEKDQNTLNEGFKPISETPCKVDSDKVLVLADSDDEDIEKVIRDPQPHLEEERIKTVIETLNLTLEEAFFLSYALGCLQVIDMFGQLLTFKQLWNMFCEVKEDFIESYVAYHYFRAKGWVVKSGYKFGGDFLLYKQGPAFYHASYVVLVERVDGQLRQRKRTPTWTKLHGLHRLAENSGKDIITCQILFPEHLTAADLQTPKSLPKFQVNELLTKRWISSQERDGNDKLLS